MYQIETVGAIISRSIVSDISELILSKASRKAIYIVLFQAHTLNIYGIVDEHQVRFVGFGFSQYATCIHSIHVSIEQLVFSVIDLVSVDKSPLLIKNVHHTGAVVSYR
jgi:hypothetical protein